MALVVLGPLVSAVSGTVDGVVFHGGQRAGVLSSLPCRVKGCTDVQRDRRRAFARAQAYWTSLDAGSQAAWATWASKHPLPNRLSVYRCLTARAACVAYQMAIDPTVSSPTPAYYPPSGPASQAPIVGAVAFSHGGPYDVTFLNGTVHSTVGNVFVQRRVASGKRPGPNDNVYVGAYIAAAGVVNLYSVFAGSSTLLAAGERVIVTTDWILSGSWPSQRVWFETTVS